jgi:hypothetical protein
VSPDVLDAARICGSMILRNSKLVEGDGVAVLDVVDFADKLELLIKVGLSCKCRYSRIEDKRLGT